MDNKNKTAGSSTLPQIVKGLIAVMLTILMVAIITMLFAKSLFYTDASASSKKTGRLTEVSYVSVSKTQTEPVTETEKKTTTTKNDEDPYQTGDTPQNLGDATSMTVVSAVYLHPEPTSKSENLLVIPQGATVKVYRNENGWLYLEYNGQMGYAYESFFSNV